MNRIIASLIVALTLMPACINDQAGKFDDYVERSEPYRAKLTTVECDGRHDISGDYLISAATNLAREKPLLLNTTFSVDTTAWTVTCDFHTVNLTDDTLGERVDVGELYSATSDIAEDGSFLLDFGVVDVLGAANPITKTDIQANLQFVGCTKSADLACGLIEGNVVVPDLDLATSTWGSARVDTTIVDAPVVSSCPDTNTTATQ